MKVQYFHDTDTLYIELRPGDVVQTRDLDENTLLDLDADGNVCAITFEHARERTDVLAHEYFGLDDDVLCDIALNQAQRLVEQLRGCWGGV